jgi:formylmethanofuran dehydrogenase subunit E
LVALQIEEKQGNIEREKRVNELEVPNVNTMAAAPIAAQAPIKEPKEVTMWKCEACGEEMKSTSKGFHVGRHCKVLHPKVEAETPQEG